MKYIEKIQAEMFKNSALIIFISALAVRLIYWFDVRNNFLLVPPLLDAEIYNNWAINIVNTGNWLGTDTFFLNPGYPYVVALIYKIFSINIDIVRLFQFIVDAASGLITFYIANELFGKKVGVVAGLIYSVYGVFIFYAGNLVNIVWINFANLFAIFLLLKSKKSKKPIIYYLLSGMLFGVSILFRPNMALFVATVILLDLVYWRSRIKYDFALLLGMLLILSPVILRNKVVTNEVSVSGVSMGINFYIGNHHQSDGSNHAMKVVGILASSPVTMLDYFRKEAERKIAGGQISFIDMDKYWLRQGLEEIRKFPLKWVMVVIKKIYLFISSQEMASNYNYEMVKNEFSIVLRLCMSYINIMPLSVIGFVYLIKNKEMKQVYLLLVLFMTYFITVLVFFMLAEYRLPAIPVLIIFASYGLVQIRQKTNAKICVAVFIIIWTMPKFYENIYKINSPMYYYHQGRTFSYMGRNMDAGNYYEKAYVLGKNDVAVLRMLGNAFVDMGHWERAKEIIGKEIAIEPSSMALVNMAFVNYKMGEYEIAKTFYNKSLELDPINRMSLDGLASIEYLLKNYKRAYEIWENLANTEKDPEEKKQIQHNLEQLKTMMK